MKRNLLAFVTIALLLAACGGPKVSTTQISGVVVNLSGLPVPGVRVLVPGKSIVTTDASGAFTFDEVTVPYTLIVEQKSDEFVVYQGINRTDPQVFVSGSTGSYETNLDGTVASTTAGNTLGLQLASAHALGSTTMSATAGSTDYNFDVTLFQPVTRGTLYALEWSKDASGNAQDFSGYGVYSGDLDLAAGASHSNLNISLMAVSGTHDLDVSVSTPSGLNPGFQIAGVRFADTPEYAVPLLTYADFAPASNQYTVRSPDLAAARMVLVAAASQSPGVYSIRWESVASSSAAHTLILNDPVELLDPADGANVGTDATFRWQPPSGAISIAFFSGDLKVWVYTAGSETTLPDLSSFGAGYGPNPYTWSVGAYRLDGIVEGEMDQLTAPGGVSPMQALFAAYFGAPLSEGGFLVGSEERTVNLP